MVSIGKVSIGKDELFMLLGFLIVLATGLSILYMFGSFGSTNITGASIVLGNVLCKETNEGILCNGILYPFPSDAGCPKGFAQYCTNACLLENEIYNKNYPCKSSCKFVCLPKRT
ncbi:MAG: hypothetical protein ACP5IJ_01350 [Candidatus Nanoarchaeia archaeon]